MSTECDDEVVTYTECDEGGCSTCPGCDEGGCNTCTGCDEGGCNTCTGCDEGDELVTTVSCVVPLSLVGDTYLWQWP